MEKWDAGRINEKKEVLTYDLTNLVHGQEEAQKAKEASRALFSGIGDDSSMPTTVLKEEEIPADGIALTELMLLCRLAASKTEARRLIQQSGVSNSGLIYTLSNGKTINRYRGGYHKYKISFYQRAGRWQTKER